MFFHLFSVLLNFLSLLSKEQNACLWKILCFFFRVFLIFFCRFTSSLKNYEHIKNCKNGYKNKEEENAFTSSWSSLSLFKVLFVSEKSLKDKVTKVF